MNVSYDLNNDGILDVKFVKEKSIVTNVYEVQVKNAYSLSNGTTGILIYAANTSEVLPRVWEDKMYLYPIPCDELILNPKLGQNADWE
jgi:hypothetical protein